MPNGKIVFSSTRDVKYCQCNRHISPNLFVMEADGRNILQIGRNNLAELHASLLPDGRILYDRWEYVDRHFGPSFGLWTCNPDGTNHALYYGSNAWSPGAIIQARAIPGQRPRGAASSARATTGPGARWRSSIVGRAWTVPPRWFGSGRPMPSGCSDGIDNCSMDFIGQDRLRSRGVAEVRRPLAAGRRAGRGAGKVFLVSRGIAGAHLAGESVRRPADGDLPGRHLRQRDAAARRGAGLLRSQAAGRLRPAAGDSRSGSTWRKARDISTSRTSIAAAGMEQVPRGTIKYLRVIEAPPKRSWSDPAYGIDATQAPAMNWNLTVNKRIIGDVPVEADGSAYFSAPAGRFLYFQALDADKMMVQSMRSGTTLMPGEVAGCTRLPRESPRRRAVAVHRTGRHARPAQRACKPWYGPERDFNYLTEVQPVFDRHCVRCHDYGRPDGKR